MGAERHRRRRLFIALGILLFVACTCLSALVAIGQRLDERAPPLNDATTAASRAELASPAVSPPIAPPAKKSAAPVPKPKETAPGRGKSYADALYRMVRPKLGENLSSNGGRELFVRTIEAGNDNPEWRLDLLNRRQDLRTGVRTFWYDLADGSRITFQAKSAGEPGAGIVLTRVVIRR